MKVMFLGQEFLVRTTWGVDSSSANNSGFTWLVTERNAEGDRKSKGDKKLKELREAEGGLGKQTEILRETEQDWGRVEEAEGNSETERKCKVEGGLGKLREI